MSAGGEEVSRIVIAQRIRNRIIEYLEVASSFEEQLEYQAAAPIAHVAAEMINQWEDWVHDPNDAFFAEPVFSPAEQDAIKAFNGVWDRVADDTPNPLPELSVLMGTEPWQRLQEAAASALEVFQRRGKFDEEKEAFE
jgi:hypothetical protein